MVLLKGLLDDTEKAYAECLKDKELVPLAGSTCTKHIRKLDRIVKQNKFSSSDKIRYESAIIQLKSIRKEILALRKVGFGMSRVQYLSDRVKWVDCESAFQSRIRTGAIMNLKHKDPFNFLNDCLILFSQRIRSVMKEFMSIKVNTTLCCEYVLIKGDGSQVFDVKYMNTRNQSIYRYMDLKEWFRNYIFNPISKKLSEFYERNSGWTLVRVISLSVNINKLNPLHASSYIDLPKQIKSKKACINIENADTACFAWSIVAALYPVENNSRRTSKYPHYSTVLNLKGIEMPMTIKQVPRFEALNGEISVNIYTLKLTKKDKYGVFPIYLTKQKRDKHINLLMIQNEYYYDNDSVSFGNGNREDEECVIKYHFVWIKNLSRLISSQLSKDEHQKFFCDRCFNYFYSQENLDRHTEDCLNLNECKLKIPSDEQKIVKFNNYKNKEKVPFVIYSDLESILKPVHVNNKYQQHIPSAIGYYVKCCYDDSLSFYRSYRGDDCIEWFTKELAQFAEDVETVFQCSYDMDPLTPEQELSFQQATHCHVCEQPFVEGDRKVRDHFHLLSRNNNKGDLTTNYRGAAHNKCNLIYQDSHVIPIVYHNLSGYDSSFILKKIALDIQGCMSLLPITKEKYISFSKHIDGSSIQFRFIDSFRFLSSSLDNLISNLLLEQLTNLKHFFPCVEEFNLVSKKGVYPYDYMSSFDKFNEQELPPIEAFYNRLENKQCSKSSYSRAKLVWNKLNIQNLGAYTDLYLKTDILLLADVFEQFRVSCLQTYDLDPAHYFTLPSYTWDCMLKYTKINLELLDDVDKILFIERGIRGGLSVCSKRRSHANNKYMSEFDSNKPESYIMYWDLNNQYGWGMSQYLGYKDFIWVDEEKLDQINIKEIADDVDVGYILEVDLEYPVELHDFHKDLPFLPEHCIAPNSKEKKLMATLSNKSKYVLHYRALKQALQHGIKLTKIHRALRFTQAAWLKPYIDLNTNLRKNAKTNFEKDLFKLMNNAVFGKTIENIRKHSIVKLVSKWEGRYGVEAYISNSRFKSCTIFDENFVAIELNKTEIYFNKPIYVGMSILDIARTSLYDYHYRYMLKAYGSNCSLLYTDTDSLIYEIHNQNPYENIRRDCLEYYDTSDYPKNNIYSIPQVNKKVIGLMKDEMNGRIITDFVGLRSKMYTVKLVPDSRERKRKREELEAEGLNADIDICNEGLTKKAKGVKKSVVHTKISFNDYVDCLENLTEKSVNQNLIKAEKLIVSSIVQQKTALSPHDDKRYLIKNSHNTLPWGHYSLV